MDSWLTTWLRQFGTFAGTGNDEIQIARGMAPDWDREEEGL